MHNNTTYILFSNKFSFISDVDSVVINLDAVFNKKPLKNSFICLCLNSCNLLITLINITISDFCNWIVYAVFESNFYNIEVIYFIEYNTYIKILFVLNTRISFFYYYFNTVFA